MLACIGILACSIFSLVVYYLFKVAKIEYKEWDINTVTAGDFTVEYIVTDNCWNEFLKVAETQYKG